MENWTTTAEKGSILCVSHVSYTHLVVYLFPCRDHLSLCVVLRMNFLFSLEGNWLLNGCAIYIAFEGEGSFAVLSFYSKSLSFFILSCYSSLKALSQSNFSLFSHLWKFLWIFLISSLTYRIIPGFSLIPLPNPRTASNPICKFVHSTEQQENCKWKRHIQLISVEKQQKIVTNQAKKRNSRWFFQN